MLAEAGEVAGPVRNVSGDWEQTANAASGPSYTAAEQLPAEPVGLTDGSVEYAGGKAMPGDTVPLPEGMSSGDLSASPSSAAQLSSITSKQQAAITKINNILNDHFVPGPKGDIAGTVSEMVGNYIPKPTGGVWNHLTEMNNSIRGLNKAISVLQTTGDATVGAIRESAVQAIKHANDAIRGIGI